MQHYRVQSSREDRTVQGRYPNGKTRVRPTASSIGLLLVLLLYLGSHAVVDNLGPAHKGRADRQTEAEHRILLPHPWFTAREKTAYAFSSRVSSRPTLANAAGR